MTQISLIRCCWVIGVAAAIDLTGCGKRVTPTGPDVLSASGSGMTAMLFRWPDGERAMVVDNVKGTHSIDGSGSTDDPTYRTIVTASSPSSAGYELQLETIGGKIASCRLNGKTYELAQGGLFLIRAAGNQVEVRQIERDLMPIDFDSKSCLEYIEKDAETRTALGTP